MTDPEYPPQPDGDPSHVMSVEDWVAVEEERKKIQEEDPS